MTSYPERASASDTPLPPPGCPAHVGPWPLSSADISHDPHDLYRRMRAEHGPVVPVVLDGGVSAWLVIDYQELKEVLRNGSVYSRDSRLWRAPLEDLVPDGWALEPHTTWRPNALFANGSEHARLRGALTRSLTRFNIGQVCRFTQDNGHRLIDAFCETGRADLVAQYAAPLPLLVLMRLFGFSDAAGQQLQSAIPALLEGGSRARDADTQVMQIIASHVARRRQEPGTDVVSWLIEDNTALLDDREICEQVWLTLAAGMGATSNWISNVFEQLVGSRDMRLGVNSGWMDIRGAMKTTLWERPPVQKVIGRWAVRDSDLGGRHIRRGDMLVLDLAAANLDPCHTMEGTARSSYTDRNEAHLAWGNGAHQCPVPELAQVITNAAVECLWTRLPDVHLSDPERPLDWGRSIIVKALDSLDVSFGPAKPRAHAKQATRRPGDS